MIDERIVALYVDTAKPEIWESKCGKWHSRCPTCHRRRNHRTRDLAMDKGKNVCRKCRIKRGTDYWAILRLIRQKRHATAEQASIGW